MTRTRAIEHVLTAEDAESRLVARFVSVATATPTDLFALAKAKRATSSALEVLASFAIDHT